MVTTEIVQSDPEMHIISYIYSCGHKFDKTDDSVKTFVNDEFQITSGAGATIKVHKNGRRKGSPIREYEINERFKTNDIDRQGSQTIERYYRINDHDDYHVVKYSDLPDPEFKHVDCKKCGNDWKCQSGLPIEDYFLVELNPDQSFLESFTIRCLNCNHCWSLKES